MKRKRPRESSRTSSGSSPVGVRLEEGAEDDLARARATAAGRVGGFAGAAHLTPAGRPGPKVREDADHLEGDQRRIVAAAPALQTRPSRSPARLVSAVITPKTVGTPVS